MTLEGKLALVTGAGRGIGQAIARALALEGAKVIGTGFNDAEADSVNAYFKEQNLDITGIQLDVTNPDSRLAFKEKLSVDFGTVQVLINNAGITKDNLMLRMKDDEWNAVIDTNLSSVFHITKLFLRGMMKERWGRIISISSVVAVIGNAGQPNYCAAKAGLIGFSKSLAQEVASRGITVNTVAPGFIDTVMTQKLTDEQRQQLLQRVPVNRMGTPEDIASAVSFLASPDASYITGQTLHVNGGMLMV